MANFSLDLFDPEKNLFIEASAGTGKTYTIQLMVAKLLSQGTPLKRILIVTYTEKAAGELKERIRKKISEVLRDHYIDQSNKSDILDDSTLKLFDKAYQDVDNAAIFTIHSFCQKTLKEYAYDAGRPFSMSMIDDGDVKTLVEKLVRDNWIHNEDFQKLLKLKNTQDLVDNLITLLKNGVNSYKGSIEDSPIIPLVEVAPMQLNGQEISIDVALQISEAENFKDLDKILSLQDKIQILEDNKTKTCFKNGKGIIGDFLKSIVSWTRGKNLFDGNTFKDGTHPKEDWKPELYQTFLYFKDLKGLLGNAEKEAYTKLLHNFVLSQIPLIFDEWQALKIESKKQSFNDMILSVRKAITNGSNSLKTRLRSQYKYAIIDEFQDTNQMQWDIFSTIFHKDNGSPIEGHSIFVVGDPKQSIYSFQGADVNVYKKATQEIGNSLSLEYNYRSTEGIIQGCNALFKGSFFTPAKDSPKLVEFNNSLAPEGAIKSPEIITSEGNKTLPPFWISEDQISPEDFAQTVATKIVDWCRFEGDKTVLQVYDKDHKETPRNVTFRDFAVLARTRTEMEVIEDVFRQAGIPFSRYKDTNLFNSRECAEWIALFKAINAPDFSAWNRRLLSEVLITDFFKSVFRKGDYANDDMAELHYVESKIFDDPNNKQRKQLNNWRQLALKRRYAELLESIYNDTQIEQRLMEVSRLQNLARLRQIGNYATDYLYNHNSSIEDLVRHLERLSNFREDSDDEDGNLVEKGTDYDAVQIMTIHASKGLEFPVVISFAGFKGFNDKTDGPYLYHSEENELLLGIGSEAKAARKKEELEEWKRLFYVDFTRASSILVLPRYAKWISETKKGPSVKAEFKFLKESIDSFCKDSENAKYFTALPTVTDFDGKKMVKRVKDEILAKASELSNSEENLSPEDLQEKIRQQMADQRVAMSDLQNGIAGKCIMQYSYSNLTGRGEPEVADNDGHRFNPSEEGTQEAAETTKGISIRSIDENAKNCTLEIDDDCKTRLDEEIKKFPRGSKIGNVLHHVFERIRFEDFGKACPTQTDALTNSELKNAIEEEFKKEALPLWKHYDNWYELAVHYVWNTLNATLPEIAGCNATEESTFKLTSLPVNNHKAEVQFNLNATDKASIATHDSAESVAANETQNVTDYIRRFCKGFIDLMFVRKDAEGNTRYSILDWKSDVLDDNDYCPENLKEKVDKEYSVQRVLYSYCLIQWLKQFFGKGTVENLDEEQIFQKHFGGIYYAFIRGTEAETGKGIYAQTWNSFGDLEAAFENVKKLMRASSRKEAK